MTPESSNFVIVRPSRRTFRHQLGGILALGAIACVCVHLFVADPFNFIVYVAVGVVGIVGIVGQLRAYSAAVRAVVATPKFVGLIHRNGAREYIPWEQIHRASHSTGLWGRRWFLRYAGGSATLRDVGVSHECWGRLWRATVREVGSRSGSLWVDPVSYAVFSE